MVSLKFILPFVVIGLCCSCSVQVPNVASEPIASTEARWTVYEDRYQRMVSGAGMITVSLKNQKFLLHDSNGDLVIETDCSTGIPGRETPTGLFRIKEMQIDKRSNKYEKYVSKETGEVVVEKSWEVDGPPSGTQFLGTAMPYWMRLTWQGVGIHVGKFSRGNRSSFGCVRMPEGIQPLIYEKCGSGMKVKIVAGATDEP